MKKEEICAGIITFNPDVNRLIKNIDAISKQVTHVYICDNGSSNINEIKEIICNCGISKEISLIRLDNNYGIAYALNRVFDIAMKIGYSWVLTLDQDSICPLDLIDNYIKYEGVYSKVGIYCPQINDINRDENIQLKDSAIEIEKCITSAALTLVEAWNTSGYFDEFLFIDSVDFDFCKKIRNKAFKIVQVNSVAIQHEIGKIKKFNVLGKSFTPMNHSSFRKYYISRNAIYLSKKYEDESLLHSLLSIGKLFLLTVLFESKKREKLDAILKGAYDGMRLKV